MEFLRADIVVDVVKLVVLDEQGVAAGAAPVADQYAACSSLGNFDFRGEAVGAVEHLYGDVFRHCLRAGIVDVGLPRLAELGTLVTESSGAATVEWQHIILAGLDVPQSDHLD